MKPKFCCVGWACEGGLGVAVDVGAGAGADAGSSTGVVNGLFSKGLGGGVGACAGPREKCGSAETSAGAGAVDGLDGSWGDPFADIGCCPLVGSLKSVSQLMGAFAGTDAGGATALSGDQRICPPAEPSSSSSCS